LLAEVAATDTQFPARTCGGLVTVAVAGLYSIGLGRAWGLDAAVTVHNFIVTPSLFDPFRRQLVYNNHVLFSFVDHLVYSLTGSADERVLRVVPILASALSVGVLADAVARRAGALAAFAAAAVVAASPILLVSGRDARGYSMLLLACVISTVLLFELRVSTSRSLPRVLGYVLALAAGIATHLYGLAMIPLHAAILGYGRADLHRWLVRWVVGGGAGLAAYVAIASKMVHAHGAREFQPKFPLTLAGQLLGGTPLTVVLLAIPLTAGMVALRRRTWALRAAAVVAPIVLGLWLLAPQYLLPRFFVWLLPAIAYGVAVGVARARALSLLIAAFVVVEAIRFGPGFAHSDMPNRTASALADQVARAGGTPCALGGLSADAMEPYYPTIKVVDLAPTPPRCDVVLVVFVPVPVNTVKLPPSWRAAFPYRRVLPADYPGLAFSRRSALATSFSSSTYRGRSRSQLNRS